MKTRASIKMIFLDTYALVKIAEDREFWESLDQEGVTLSLNLAELQNYPTSLKD